MSENQKNTLATNALADLTATAAKEGEVIISAREMSSCAAHDCFNFCS